MKAAGKIGILALACVLSLIMTVFAASPVLDGQVSASSEEIYPGVYATEYYLEGGESYGSEKQFVRVLEFDPANEELNFDVVMAGDYLGEKKVLSQIIDEFNKNGENKKTVFAANGDLWTQASHHSRVEGESSDPVVKREICLPRGYTVIDGEIICSQNMSIETPFDEFFLSFGLTEDKTPYIGNISTSIKFKNTTKGTKKYQAQGFNRLPADNGIVVYSDKGPVSNYCLDDAYEVIIDCDYDYRFFHGETITGKVAAVSEPGSQRYPMKQNRIILTARGDSMISRVNTMEVGDEITLEVSIRDMNGNNEVWQSITECVGGHIPVIYEGEHATTGVTDRSDPMTLIGYKADGTVVIIVNDGRQPGYSMGINRKQFADLCDDLGVVSAMLLDGGGSTTLIEETENGYELKNRPSDYYTGASSSLERAIINAVIISRTEETAAVTGDVNGDGKMNISDIFTLKTVLAGMSEESEAADVNGDGKTNLSDILLLKSLLVGA